MDYHYGNSFDCDVNQEREDKMKVVAELLVFTGMFTLIFFGLWFFTAKDLLEIFVLSSFGAFFVAIPVMIYLEEKLNG